MNAAVVLFSKGVVQTPQGLKDDFRWRRMASPFRSLLPVRSRCRCCSAAIEGWPVREHMHSCKTVKVHYGSYGGFKDV